MTITARAALAAATLGALAAPATAQDVTLRLADSFPLTHVISTEGAQYFIRRVQEESDGRIAVQHFPASQLGKAGDMLTLVQTGVADMAYVPPAYVQSKMPMSDAAHLPGLYSDVCQGARAYMKLAQEGPLREVDYDGQDIRLIFATPLAPYEISGPDAPIRSLEDLKGMKVRATSAATNMVVEALGAVPVNISSGAEIYDALERGTIDFNLGPYSSYKAYDLYDQTSYGTTGFGFSSFVVGYSISARTFDRMPEDLQKIVMEVGAETSAHVCAAVMEENTRAIEEMRALGAEFLEATDETRDAYQAIATELQTRWATDLDERGLPGTETLEAMKAALAE